MANLGTGNDNINIDGATSSFVDFGGTDTYTILSSLSGDVTITDNQASTFNLPAGLTITDASFLSDGVQFTINGFTLTLIGNPSLFSFVFGGTPLDPTAGTAQTFEETAAAFGTTVPAVGEPANSATTTGDINGDGSVGTGTPPGGTYALAADAAAVDEGASATFTVTTTGVAEGTEVAYTISGVDAADVTGALTGTATVGADGKATISVAVAADATTEGEETLTVTLDDDATATASVTVNDTSTAAQTLDLTTGVDTATGGDGDDIINGVVSALSSEATLNPTDQIDGAGGMDTLNAEMKLGFTGFSGTGFLKNVETVNLTNTSAVVREFDASGVTGATTYNLKGNVNLKDLDSVAGVNLSDRAGQDFTVAYASKVTDGTSDTLALGLNNVGTKADSKATPAVSEDTVVITAAGIETLALTATGTNVIDLAAGGAKAVTAAGAGSLEINTLGAAAKTFDGSAATGAIDLTLGAATAMTSVQTGSGDDKIGVDITDELIGNAVVSGGAGADTLSLTGVNANALELNQSGIETVVLNVTGNQTLSLKNTTDVTKYVADDTLGGDVILANSAGDLALDLQGAAAAGTARTVTLDTSGAVTVNAVATSSTASATARDTANDSATLTKASSVALNVAANTEYTGTVLAADANSVTIASKGEIDGATLTASKATAVIISEVGQDSDMTLNVTKATTLDITNGKNFTLNAGSDLSDVQTFTSKGAGNIDLVNGGVGGDLGALNQATISNTGTVMLDKIGSATQEYAASVALSGTGATTFTDLIETKGQAINITGSSTGAVALQAAVDSLNGAAAAGDVTIDLDTTSTLGLSTITGKNVTVDAGGVLGVVTFGGAITATGNVAVTGSGLTATDLGTNDIILNGTSQSVTLNSGVVNDTFDIVGSATSTSITVSGNLGSGDNDVDVNGSNATAAQTINISGLTSYDNSVILGSGQVDTITGGADVDTITGGVGADKMTGGGSADIFIIADADAAIDAAGVGADQILDFNTGGSDVIRFAAADNVAADDVVATPVAGTSGSITGGKLTFNAADDTLTEQIVIAIAETAADEVVFWENGGSTYVYNSGATGDGSDDLMVQLVGVTGLTTLTESGVTAGDFTLA